MVGMGERVGERELRAVRDAVERRSCRRRAPAARPRGPPRARRCCRSRAAARAAPRTRRPPPARCRRRGALQRGAVEHPGRARAAVVVGDERVAGEEAAVQRRRAARVTEAVDVGRALARPARDQEDHAARNALRGQFLDVQRDRARHDPGAIERDGKVGAEHAGRLAAGREGGGRRDAVAPRAVRAAKGRAQELRAELRRRERGRCGCVRSAGRRAHAGDERQREHEQDTRTPQQLLIDPGHAPVKVAARRG